MFKFKLLICNSLKYYIRLGKNSMILKSKIKTVEGDVSNQATPGRGLGFKLFMVALITSIICSLIYLGDLVYQFGQSTSEIFLSKSQRPSPALIGEENDEKLLIKEGDSRINILLAGKGGPGHNGGDLTDAIIVASIDSINKKVSLLSIPRDLYLDIGDGQFNRINSVYSIAKSVKYGQTSSIKQANQAGMDALAGLIGHYFDIPINYYVLADFSSFIATIDIIGGVEMEFEEPIYIKFANLNIPSGRQVLDGRTALALIRDRNYKDGDFVRSKKQRELLLALKK